jgi:hypothetical protein
MSDPQDARDKLNDLASRLKVNIDDIVGDLLSPSKTAPSPAPVDIPLSDGAIKAAICDSYSASEPWAADLDHSVLKRSDLIMIDGRRRLRLSDAARGAVLRAAAESGDRLRALLEEADRHSGDQPTLSQTDARSASLRRILKGETPDLAGASPAQLRVAVAALERLREAPLPENVPSFTAAQRLLERAELLEPLRMQIGATGAWDNAPEDDRFVGRARQLMVLRAFVDEIKSRGAMESIQRNMSGASRALRRSLGDQKVEGVRLIVARGGLGKSALIAKFVLDHALTKGNPFPFAYLDFDRASIQAREPRQLLMEVVRQVALQFPHVTELVALRDSVRHSFTSTTSRRTMDSDSFEEFRRIVRDKITHGARALLIVFDTIEIAQSDAASMKGLLAFMDRMSQGGFGELRLVAAGRAPAPQLLEETYVRHRGEVMTLEPLALDDARKMVKKLGEALLPGDWRESWTLRLAGKKSDLPERREPLSLRVAVETLRDEQPEDRDAASLKIEQLGEEGSENFVGKLYMNRVVGHVTGGDDVRKLAWPGLVMRRITPDIIRSALAPILNINPNASKELFESLSSQLWIVSREGNVLRHEPDLRARTLPLMRRKAEFRAVNAAAIKYYEEGRDLWPEHRAEWIYHRLLAGEPPQKVDRDWTDAVVPLLKGAVDDFPPRSVEADYLSVRTSDQLQPDALLNRVEPRLALLHVARVGISKGNLTDTSLDPLLLSLPIDGIPPASLPPEAAAARICLMVKTGRWQLQAETGRDEHGAWKDHLTASVAYRRARMVDVDTSSLNRHLEQTYSSSASELATIGVLVQDLAAARLAHWPGAERLDQLVVHRLRSRSSSADAAVGAAVLRTAMTFGYRATIAAARMWGMQAMEWLRATHRGAVSSRELNALLPDAQLESAARQALDAAGVSWEAYLEQTKQQADRTSLHNPELATAVIDAVVRRAERGEPGDIHQLRMFAAARDEDWLLPFAYAAHRATAGKVPAPVSLLFEKYQPRQRGFVERSMRRRANAPADVLDVCRRCDQASDLEGAAHFFLAHSDPTPAADLRRLLSWYRGWRNAIENLLSPPVA